MSRHARLAARAQVSGDRLLRSDPRGAAERYGRCAELYLAQLLLGAAQRSAADSPLGALSLLRRFEALSSPCPVSLRAVAVAYLALGELQIARRFLAAAQRLARAAQAARPYRPSACRHAISS
ncbi:MAG: hypothetical protein JKY65_22330 [Planctomycetes bacterium]|nr:hypothetical protein [Planctomycetota bacterium]